MSFDNQLKEPDMDRRLDSIVKQASYRCTKVPQKVYTQQQAFGIATALTGALFLFMSANYTFQLAKASRNYSEGVYGMLFSAGMIAFGNYVRRQS